MSLTDDEQQVFNRALDGDYIDEPDDKVFMRQLGKVLHELTGNVMLWNRIENVVEQL